MMADEVLMTSTHLATGIFSDTAVILLRVELDNELFFHRRHRTFVAGRE